MKSHTKLTIDNGVYRGMMVVVQKCRQGDNIMWHCEKCGASTPRECKCYAVAQKTTPVDAVRILTNLDSEATGVALKDAYDRGVDAAASALIFMANDYPKDCSDDYYNAWKAAVANGLAAVRAQKTTSTRG